MTNDINQKSWRQLMKQFGTSYFWATLLLPSKIQYETVELYKYVRIPDQIVDNPNGDLLSKEKELSDLYNHRCNIYKNNKIDNMQFWPWLKIMKSKNIANIYMEDFRKAMKDDLKINRYETYKQLQWYMYGSAEVVWLTMCELIGYDLEHKEKTLAGARKLGEAMQLTNFLRDVMEDWTELGRIYMPRDELVRFGLDYQDILTFCNTKQINNKWIDFMLEMIARCDKLYDEANLTIKYLNKDSRDAVYVSSHLYRAILHKMKSIWYNQFANSARTSRRDKLLVIVKEQSVFKYIIGCLK